MLVSSSSVMTPSASNSFISYGGEGGGGGAWADLSFLAAVNTQKETL